MSFGKHLAAAAAAALIAGGALLATSDTADAQWRRGYGYYGGGYGYRGGGAVAAGLIGGLALGAIAASAVPAYGYYGGYPAYGYYSGPTIPAYSWRYAPAYSDGYATQCWWQRQRVAGPWGWEVRRVRVCR